MVLFVFVDEITGRPAIFGVKVLNLCKLTQIFVLLVRIKIIFIFVKFVATNKDKTTNFFPYFSVAVVGSEIQDPRWIKIRIRDQHPGSATLETSR